MSIAKRILFGLDVLCLAIVGAVFGTFLRVLPDTGPQHWIMMGQCLAVMLLLIAGLAIMAGEGWAVHITISSIALAYIVAAISLAAGRWAWDAAINAGSAHPALALGSRIVGEGDLSPYRTDLRLWSAEIVVLAIIAVAAIRLTVTRLRRHETPSAPSDSPQ